MALTGKRGDPADKADLQAHAVFSQVSSQIIKIRWRPSEPTNGAN